MARLRIVPNITSGSNITPGVEDASLAVTYAFRAKIIADRYTRGFEMAQVDGGPNAYETSGLPIFETEKLALERKIHEERSKREYAIVAKDGYTFEPTKRVGEYNFNRAIVDTISIVDIDFESKHQSFRGYDVLTLPFVPRELSYDPASKFVGIATMGRNNPHYHFTGSEDTLQFDIDWFSAEDSRYDVINSCRWIEALSKSDGYIEAPHRIKLVWGQDDLLWADCIWLVVAAPYTLFDFVKAYRNPLDKNEIIRAGMLPQAATQKITLKRVNRDNLSAFEIINRIV